MYTPAAQKSRGEKDGKKNGGVRLGGVFFKESEPDHTHPNKIGSHPGTEEGYNRALSVDLLKADTMMPVRA